MGELLTNSFVGALCNGSISDFDSESVGSIPTAPASFVYVCTVPICE